MTYTTQTWSDGNPSYPVSAARMAHIESGLGGVDGKITGLDLSVTSNLRIDLSASTLTAPSGGAVQNIYHLVKAAAGQTNASRGDAINSDAANSPSSDHSSLAGIELRSTGSAAHVEKGSIHQMYRALRVDPYSGGGDVYTEGLADYIGVDANRKGALIGPAEWLTNILAGKPARVSGHRIIMQEFNPLAAYDSATFGVGSPWIATGARGLEILAQGSGASPLGTGIQLHGSAGFTRAINLNTGGVDRFQLDGAGFINIQRSAGAGTAIRLIVDADTTEHLLIRADGKMQWTDGAGGGAVTLERSASTVLLVTGTFRATVGIGTAHVGAATPTGGASGDIRVGTGKIWANDAGTWKSAAIT